MNGQQRPMNGQQRPMNGQQRPMNGQQRPMNPQQRPMNGQQIPINGQQRPRNNQQRPGNNQQRPRNNQDSAVNQMGKLVIIISAILLVIAILIGAVAIAFSAGAGSGFFLGNMFDWVTDLFDKNDTNTDDPDDDDRPAKDDDKEDNGSSSGIKTSLKLPVVTPDNNYLRGYSSGAEAISGITSAAAVLVDMQSGKTIASKKADERIHPASMTKVMTLIVACENLTDSSELLTVEQWMIDYMIAEEGSGITYSAGEQITVEDALYLISYKSDTIACLLVAQKVAGSEAAFVKKMNDKAKAIGLTNTHFANTTGLYESKDNYNYTTCREMAAIMECAMNNSAVKGIITSYAGRRVSIYTKGVESRYTTIYTRWYSFDDRFNDDPTIAGTSEKMRAIAGKTGGEDIPSSCFVTVAENTVTGDRYICVTVGRISQSDGSYVSEKVSTEDTEKIYRNYAYNG